MGQKRELDGQWGPESGSRSESSQGRGVLRGIQDSVEEKNATDRCGTTARAAEAFGGFK